MKTRKVRKDGRPDSSGPHTSIQSNALDAGNSFSHSMRRASKRIQNMHKSTASPGQLGLVDSAYDADEESVTPNSSPEQQAEPIKDPYEMDMTDDEVPAVKTKQRRKKDPKKANNHQLVKKKQKKAKNLTSVNKHNPTSTPVLHSSGDVVSKLHESGSLSGTPEVTPILPYKPHECASSDSFATPQIHRASKKRSLQPDSLTSLSTQLSYSTPGDSGIALSPVSKKHRSAASDTEKLTTELESRHSIPHKRSTMPMKENKEQKYTSNVFEHLQIKKKNIFSPITEINKPDEHKRLQVNKKTILEDSCFGFDSLSSPLIATENSPPPKPRRLKNSKKGKNSISSKDAYRLKRTNSSDSSPACVINDLRLSLETESSQENLPRNKSSSPTLFSDSFSADSESLEMDVNKSSDRAYKPSKVRRIKEKGNVSKLDVWATNFNMEIEDIEKFDLNIE